jgi:hypothetical protein
MPQRLLLAALFVAIAGCASPPPASVHTTDPASSTLQGDASRPAQAQWIRTELYFSVGSVEGKQGAVSPERWREFLMASRRSMLMGSGVIMAQRSLSA